MKFYQYFTLKVQYPENIPLGNGLHTYRLLSEPKTIVEKPKKAIELLISKINNTYDGKIDTESLSSLLEQEGLQVVRKYGSHKKTK